MKTKVNVFAKIKDFVTIGSKNLKVPPIYLFKDYCILVSVIN